MSDFARNPLKTDRIDTPELDPADLYRDAQRAWDSRMSSVLRVAGRQTILIYGLLATVAVLVASHAVLYSQKDVAAYLIRENSSEIVDLRGPWSPSDGAKRSRLQDLIEKWRALPLDPIVYAANQELVAKWVDGETADRIRTDYQKKREEAESRKTAACTAIQVRVLAVQPLSGGAWQVRWEETCFANGKRLRTETFTGAGSFEDLPPKTLTDLQVNPLGLLLTKFTWIQDYARGTN